MRGLEATARAALDARLDLQSRRPLTIAFSGGGDSLALLLIADAWARERGRELIVLHVDHQLRAESGQWAERCRAVAEGLGRDIAILPWTGDKPAAGLPAAARAARHALLAQAARQQGAVVILMGHTADDLAEGAAMREAGSTTPDPRDWAPSPAWPEGRGVFLLRPLLGARRADLRAWLEARGETWIDDPANTDPRYARVRARLAGAQPTSPSPPPPLRLADQVREEAGVFTASRDLFAQPDGGRLLSMACVCAGGGSRLPSGERLERLLTALCAAGPVTATLAGARIEADDMTVRIFREAGEWRRNGLRQGCDNVWDGRWEVLGDGDPPPRPALPARMRKTLPQVGEAISLVGQRLRAAAGLVEREPA